jgi:hypothetical protein
MVLIWQKLQGRFKGKLSPRSMVARFPPLDPGIPQIKDINSDKGKQKNWMLVARELKKFDIEINAIVRDMLIAGDRELIAKLVHMLVNYDLNNGDMTMDRVLEPDFID